MNAPDKQPGPWQGREPLLAGITLFLLLAGCFLVLKPFMTALMWAVILSYTLFPMQRLFTRWFRGARTLAACVVALTVAVIFAGPVVLIAMSIADDGKELAGATRDWFLNAPEQAPGWVSGVPVVGDELGGYWERFAADRNRWIDLIDEQVKGEDELRVKDSQDIEKPSSDPDSTQAQGEGVVGPVGDTIGPVVEELTDGEQFVDGPEGKAGDKSPQLIVMTGKFLSWARTWLLAAAKAVGNGVTQVLLSAFIAFFLLRDAPELSRRLSVAVERLAGERGQRLLKVAGDTVRGVIFGILGTALAQAVVAGIGFWIAGVPAAVLLSVLTFFFAVIPYGPPLIWVPASIWLYTDGHVGMSIFLFIWGAGVIGLVDNFLRPYLISQGSKTPFILIFCGVIGGALAFGLVGVFLGPILLAVGYRLISEWTTAPDAKLGDSLKDESESGEPDSKAAANA